MRIIGFNFKKISAERKKNLKGKLEIKSNINIENIEKEKVDIAGEVLKFYFINTIKYEPGLAEIVFKGSILAMPEKSEDIKKILKEWKKKKIDENIQLFIFNFIMSKCNLKALQLEEEFALPPHVRMPKLTKKQPGKVNYTG